MKQLIVYLIYFLCGGISLFGQDSLKIKFRSRALLDATVSGYGKEQAQGYYSLEDFRVGFKAVYGKYELKADIGLGGGKVAIKDLMLNYHLKNSVLALGNGYEPFSMDMLISTVDLRFHQSATSVLAFADSRKFGITYHYYNKHCYLATGVYTNNDINKLGGESHKNSFVSTSRGVVRKIKDKGWLLHVGGAVSYRTSQVNVEESPIGSVSSDGVTSMFPAALLEADIPDMGSELKGVIEFLYTAPRFMIQSEYFFDCLHRTSGQNSYRAHGGYIQGGILLKGREFEYDTMYAVPGRPVTSQAIELVARFNYTDMNDERSGILGGEEKDLSLGINFYLNRYLGIKINGSYVWVGDFCNSFYQKNFFLSQLRLQYVF